MPFDEDDAIEIAFSDPKVEEFDSKYPDAVYNIEKMKPKATEAWIKANPSADVGDGVKNLWIVEIEELAKEKLVAILSPKTKKVLETKIEGSEPIPEDTDDDEEEEKPKKKKAKKK